MSTFHDEALADTTGANFLDFCEVLHGNRKGGWLRCGSCREEGTHGHSQESKGCKQANGRVGLIVYLATRRVCPISYVRLNDTLQVGLHTFMHGTLHFPIIPPDYWSIGCYCHIYMEAIEIIKSQGLAFATKVRQMGRYCKSSRIANRSIGANPDPGECRAHATGDCYPYALQWPA